MPNRRSRIISNARAHPQLPTVSDRRTRQLQTNAPEDKQSVNDKLVVSVCDSSTNWFSTVGQHWLKFCQNWLHQDRRSLIVAIQVVTVRHEVTDLKISAPNSWTESPVSARNFAPFANRLLVWNGPTELRGHCQNG